ncbi:MAG: PEP-CTERM/exosortase system-associated acyltransferase [Gammaproteobacteria bacterium]|nr:PEP-CTERM/exosortase system-associated acyltransferase [Gammaproteobacteria bacterium]
MDREKIISSYKQYFNVTYATTKEQRMHAYHIRYQVYCKEFKYEREESCPDQLEQDEYDDQSFHCLLIHKPSETVAGCVRLIKPSPKGEISGLPFEHCCLEAVDKQKMDVSRLERSSFGEISRLAVLPAFRRRKADGKSPISIPDRQKLIASGRDAFPLISIILSLGILSMLLNSGLKYGFAMMEPRLTRMLRRYGIIFSQIGDVVNYHGMRGPFVIDREVILLNLSPELHELMGAIDSELQSSLKSKKL